MDVLQPDLLYIKGRCYRINPVNVNLNDDSQNKRSLEGYQNYYEADECRLDYDSEDEESKCPIEQVTGKGFRTAFHVARTYFPYIIGKKAATKKRLEMETKTQINVPKFGQEGDIVITGNNRSCVQAAYRRINLIIMTARRRQQYTHFISIPFCDDIIKTKFIEFKKDALEKCKDRGIEESVFQLPDKLHMTLCTMVLSDEVERSNAAQILQKCKTDVIDNILNGQTLKLRISGIEIMNDDPAEVNVLYGKIHCDDEDLLQLLSDSIVNYCAKAGIVEKEYDRVKLHITLMNTKFSQSNADFGNRRNRNTINATNIMKMFENYDFGETTVESIHLSQMGAVSNSGYYKPSVTINITG